MLLEGYHSHILFYLLLAHVLVVFLSYLTFARKLFNPLNPPFYYIFLKRTMGLSILLTLLFLSMDARGLFEGLGVFLLGSFLLLIGYAMTRFVIHETHTDIKKEYEKYIRGRRLIFGSRDEWQV